MSTERELLQQALEALTDIWNNGIEDYPDVLHKQIIDNISDHLAQPEAPSQEPGSAADELRRLHQVNVQLVNVLEEIFNCEKTKTSFGAACRARAAIAAAKGEEK